MCYKVQSCQAFSDTPHPTGMHSGLSDGNEATELQRRLEEHSANTQYYVEKKNEQEQRKNHSTHFTHICRRYFREGCGWQQRFSSYGEW